MGKSKKKKSRDSRNNPTDVRNGQQTDDVENGDAGATLEEYIENIIEKLKSPTTEHRECGCAILASIVKQPNAVSQLIQAQVVKVIGPFLIDKSLSLRQIAVGCLRNLSLEAGAGGAEEMVSQDIMTPLVMLLKQYSKDWINCSEFSHNMDVHKDIFVQCVHVLWNICENSEVAVKVFNQENLVSILLPHINPDIFGYVIAVTVAHCLHTVSEDNPSVSAEVSEETNLVKLISMLRTKHTSLEQLLFRTLIAGIVYNCTYSVIGQANGSVTDVIVTTLSDCLHEKSSVYALRLDDELPNGVSNGSCKESDRHLSTQEEMDVDANQVSTLQIEDLHDKKITEIERLLTAQQISLELLANLCCSSDDDEEDWNDCSSSDEQSDSMEEELADSSLLAPLCLSSEVLGLFVSKGLLELVLSKTEPIEDAVLAIINKHSKNGRLMKCFHNVQTKALFCTSNMCAGMTSDSLGGLEGLHAIWEQLSQYTLNKRVLTNLPYLEGITSAMRAVIQKLAELGSAKFSDVTARDLHFLFELGHHCDVAQIRTNVIKVVSTIGCLLSKQAEPQPLLRDIGVFLMLSAIKDSELIVTAEALDSIMDVFAEDHVNSILKEINLIEKLKKLSPALKTKVNQGKKSLGEHLPVIQTVRTNLARFIKYKSSLM